MAEPTEHWLPVPGWEGLYEVSDLGRVRSLPRQTMTGIRGGRILKAALGGHPDIQPGYPVVGLCRNGRQSHRPVHRLVLEAFVGPRPDGMECLHGPGGTFDNRWPENIRWGTRLENKADELRDGTRNRGKRHGNAKLTEEIVILCRSRYTAGETMEALAAEFGVSRTTVNDAIAGRAWSHVTWPRPIRRAMRGGS